MDTLDWGAAAASDEASEPRERPRARRLLSAASGPWVVVGLAALAFVALIGSELMPWATLHAGNAPTNNDSDTISVAAGGSFGLDRLNTLGAFAYQLGMLAVLGLVGGALFARPTQRRAMFGVALGLITAQGLNLAGLVHSFSHLIDNFVPDGRTPGYQTTIEPGAYLAIVGLLLLLAALVMSAAPERVRSRLVDAVREPADSQLTDEPFELTVTQAKPIDESHFTRPDPYIR